MNAKASLRLVGTVRHLPLCDSAVGMRIPVFIRRNCSTKTRLVKAVTQHANLCQPASTSCLSFRFLSQESPANTDEKTTQSDVKEQSSVDVSINLAKGTATQIESKIDFDDGSPLADDESVKQQWVSSRATEESNVDFYSALKRCTSPSDVLELCGSTSMNMKQISNCFTTMWETTKRIRKGQRRYERQLMLEHPNFENLCRLSMNASQRMRPEDMVYTLHAVVKLEISQRSRLVQTLLRVCQEHLNEFEEREISVLASALEIMDSSRNVDALRSGLRMLVELRMPEIRGVLPLQTMMRAIGRDAPLPLKKKLERKALGMLDEFSLPNCQHMFTTLATINLRSLPILEACSLKIINDMEGIPFWKLIHVLQACRELSYRNEGLLTAIGDYIVATIYMWQTKQVTLILSMLENLGFRHVPLLDVLAERVIQNPESLTFKDLLVTVKAYSLLNHLPEGKSQQFLNALNMSLELYLPRIPPVELLRVVFSFCILEYFPQQPLDKLLKEDILKDLLTSANHNVEINERMLHSINLCLELDKPSITKPTMALGKTAITSFTTQPEVQTALHAIVGDPSLVQHNVHLPNDYFIDFIFDFDTKQNIVVPITASQMSDNPLHVERVAVLCASMSSFALGTLHPLGKLAMKIRHLKALGYKAVLVPLHEFGRLNETERIQFLQSRIFIGKSSADKAPEMTETERNEEISNQNPSL
ncbi:FAST kinase domain-containing protein 2, mitochondrial [Xenopus laevis]|uniref:FAST kinase domain-containing protein 2, mitochondrial n=2 Tax=Xenopus laevis TaxID=8355 RepID=A0A1L8EX00_XENLA|nr:FAST kinase domain-containing protein 2, mitochondrial [Xenopus laevis]XP_018091684.1 FAST kinase domain-containing protein 2, mitochondrial [Xenopus laevis]OCT63871.1 hypothetical protein XELAEV_18044966mg [Xenopus laevis]